METTRKGTTIIYENGLPVEINSNFVDALIKAKPAIYSRVLPGQDKPKKSNLKEVAELPGEKKQAEPEKPVDTSKDGKFTVEDLMQLEYKELQELAKKLNASQNAKINTQSKKAELAKQIFKESQK
jgi:hypothetical protein